MNDLARAQRSVRADRNRTTVPVHRRGDAPSIDIVTRKTVERGFFVIGWDRCTRIDETLWIEGADRARAGLAIAAGIRRSEEHTSELQSLMRISYAVFCLKKKKTNIVHTGTHTQAPTTASRRTAHTT